MIKITKHGQSGFEIESKDTRILIDIGSFARELENIDGTRFMDIDVLFISHNHPDHFDLEILKNVLKNSRPKIVTTEAVKEKIVEEFGDTGVITSVEDYKLKDVILNTTNATHGPLPNGNEPPKVIGLKMDFRGKTIYHPGDTIKLYEKADIILTPICGQVVLSVEEAKEQLKELKPELVVGMHYDNPKFPVNPPDFLKAMKDTGIEAKILENGESIEV